MHNNFIYWWREFLSSKEKMAIYIFEAVDTSGKRLRGEVETASAKEAIDKIKAKGLRPINIKEKAGATQQPAKPAGQPAAPEAKKSTASRPAAGMAQGRAPAATGAKKRKSIWSISIGGSSVSSGQLTQFTQQFSVLLDAGLPVVRSLKILSNQMKPSALKGITATIAEDVETGSSLSDALAKHPKAFDRLYVNMVRAGEAGGILDVILQRLSSFMEKSQMLKRKVIGASIYPIVVLCIALLVVFAIMTFIIPKFKDIFKTLGDSLPAMTSFLMNMSETVGTYWYVFVILPIVAFTLVRMYIKTKGGRMAFDRMKLNLPLFGTIIRKAIISRFCRTLGTLLQSGVPILEALNIVKGATGNEVVTKAIEHVHDSIREGESIAAPLAQSKVFDDMVINMIDVGEETGELDKMLLKVADTYEQEVDIAVGGLMSALEPLLIVTLGIIVGFIVVALFLPLVSIMKNVGTKKKGGGGGH